MREISISLKRYDPNSPEQTRAIEKFRQDFAACRATLLRIDKGIFGHPWWRNIPIPGLFKVIPFEEYSADLVKLCIQIDDLKHAAEILDRGAQIAEHREILLLQSGLARYRNSAGVLYEICRGLSRHYSWKAYRADVARYRHALGFR